MLATLADEPVADHAWAFDPKYDGIRAIPGIDSRQRPPRVALWSRNGHDKTPQFPEIAESAAALATRIQDVVVLDGEIVALDATGAPLGFTRLQRRIHLSRARDVAALRTREPVAFIAFDLLRGGDRDLRARPFAERRRALERVLKGLTSAALRLSDVVEGDGRCAAASSADRSSPPCGWSTWARSRSTRGARAPPHSTRPTTFLRRGPGVDVGRIA